MSVQRLNGQTVGRNQLGIKSKKRQPVKREKKLTRGQIWWQSLSDDEKSDYISQRERNRASKRSSVRPEDLPGPEVRRGGFLKVWHSPDSYSVYRDFMWIHSDKYGYEVLPSYLWDTRKVQLEAEHKLNSRSR